MALSEKQELLFKASMAVLSFDFDAVSKYFVKASSLDIVEDEKTRHYVSIFTSEYNGLRLEMHKLSVAGPGQHKRASHCALMLNRLAIIN